MFARKGKIDVPLHTRTGITHVQDPNRVVVNLTPRRTEHDNAAVSSAFDHIIPDRRIPTGDADAVRPFLKGVRSTRPNVVVLYYNAIAIQGALSNVEAGPASWVVGANIFNELANVVASHLYIPAPIGRRRDTARAVDLRENTISLSGRQISQR